jgi:FtsZ-interacting cell division protein ZipA
MLYLWLHFMAIIGIDELLIIIIIIIIIIIVLSGSRRNRCAKFGRELEGRNV